MTTIELKWIPFNGYFDSWGSEEDVEKERAKNVREARALFPEAQIDEHGHTRADGRTHAYISEKDWDSHKRGTAVSFHGQKLDNPGTILRIKRKSGETYVYIFGGELKHGSMNEHEWYPGAHEFIVEYTVLNPADLGVN